MREFFEYYLFWIIVIVIAIVLAFIIYAVIKIKDKIWDTPQDKIRSLEREIRDSRRLVVRFLNDYCQQDFANSDRSLDNLIELLVTRSKFTLHTDTSLKAIPYMAAIMADYETLWLKQIANKLDWEGRPSHHTKVDTIYEIRRKAQEQVTKYKVAQYQLDYLFALYPELKTIVTSDTSYPFIPKDTFIKNGFVLQQEEFDRCKECLINFLSLHNISYNPNHSLFDLLTLLLSSVNSTSDCISSSAPVFQQNHVDNRSDDYEQSKLFIIQTLSDYKINFEPEQSLFSLLDTLVRKVRVDHLLCSRYEKVSFDYSISDDTINRYLVKQCAEKPDVKQQLLHRKLILLIKKCSIAESEVHQSKKYMIEYLTDHYGSDFLSLDESQSLYEIIHLFTTQKEFIECSKSSLTAIPYMAKIMSDYDTLWLKMLSQQLDWGYDAKRQKKVASINEIRRAAKEQLTTARVAQYQLAYLLELFPNLEDVLETDYAELPIINENDLSEYDNSRDFLSKEEYLKLSPCERNQLALDRYRSSHKKTKWQIGRDYELYTGYRFSKKGYKVDYFGSYMGLEDLGRDLIAKKENKTLIIQCKYWSQEKKIHEKHINQLYGTLVCYCIEHHVDQSSVTGILVTNIELSPAAVRMAKYLGIEYVEHFELGEYPCIKCNVGKDEYGLKTKIYHLPFDQQYDRTIINEKGGDFMALTVKEAEDAGFRRAYKYFGSI